MGIVGYSAGLTGSRGLVAALMLILAFTPFSPSSWTSTGRVMTSSRSASSR